MLSEQRKRAAYKAIMEALAPVVRKNLYERLLVRLNEFPLLESDAWVQNHLGRNRIFVHDSDGRERDVAAVDMVKNPFPSIMYEEAARKVCDAKFICYEIGKGGQFYDKVLQAQTADPSGRSRNKFRMVLDYFGQKGDYYHDLKYDRGDVSAPATIRLSNHPAQTLWTEGGSEISLVFPDGTYAEERKFDLNEMRNGSFEFYAGADFEYSRTEDGLKEVADDLRAFLASARKKPFSLSDVRDMLEKWTKSAKKRLADADAESAAAAPQADKATKEYAAKIFGVKPEDVDWGKMDVLRKCFEYKDAILTKGITAGPKFKYPGGRAMFWGAFAKTLTPEEMVRFKAMRKVYDANRYNATGGAPLPQNMKASSGWSKFEKLMKSLSGRPERRNLKIADLWRALKKAGVDDNYRQVAVMVKAWNHAHPDDEFVPRPRSRYPDFKAAIMDMVDGRTEGDETLSLDDWLEYLKECGLPMSQGVFYKYWNQLKNEYPKLVITKSPAKRAGDRRKEIAKLVYDYARNEYNPKMNVEDWLRYLDENGVPVERRLFHRIVDALETKYPELKPIIKAPAQVRAREYVRSNPSVLKWDAKTLQRELDKKDMKMDLSGVYKLIKDMKVELS